MEHTLEHKTYGVVAEFASGDAVLAAANRVYEAGYRKTDAYSPVPIHGLDEALGRKPSKLAWLVFCGGLTGCLLGFSMQVWMAHIDYPWNIGGRPTFSWPAFIPVTFELTILFSAFTAVIGMFALNGLPRPHNPIFNTPNFDRAAIDHYFLCIEAADPLFDEAAATALLQELGPEAVHTITDA